MTTPTAKFGGGKVKVHDDNLTDISENLFWFRESVDQGQTEAAEALQTIITLLTDISNKLSNIQTPIHVPQPNLTPPVSVYQPDTKVIQLDGVKPIDAALRWLQENDSELKLTAREAAVRASMSQATINRAQQKLRNGQ